jgi:hypothetical protein
MRRDRPYRELLREWLADPEVGRRYLDDAEHEPPEALPRALADFRRLARTPRI